MSDQTTAAPGGGESAPVEAPITVITPEGHDNFNSPSAAARALSAARWKKKEQAAPQEAAPAQESTAQADDADPAPQAPGETPDAPDPAPEEPTIEPPRSWTKEAKERWASLPRETQEYLSVREQDREREFRRSQNEAAETRKAIEAERSQVEQARQQYESALPLLLQNLQTAMAGEFADIKSMSDVERLAREDWPRYVLWDAQQKKVASVQQELKATQERTSAEQYQKWNEFARSQDALFVERVPELADKAKAAKLQEAAVSVLTDLGFTEQELGALWNGQQALSLRDHRTQLLILDGIRYREAQQKAKAAQAKPLPPVQRPGVRQSPNAAQDATIQALSQKLDKTGSLKDAAAMIAARRAAARK